jgi:hypothetical protein
VGEYYSENSLIRGWEMEEELLQLQQPERPVWDQGNLKSIRKYNLA